MFIKGPIWIIIHMDSMNSTYDDGDDEHMNVFVEYLHNLFVPTSYHTEPENIELIVPTQQDLNNCGYCLVRNIGCILKGGIKLIYKHLYNGIEFSDDDTRIELYTKAAGLDYHIDSIPLWTSEQSPICGFLVLARLQVVPCRSVRSSLKFC